MGHWNHRLFRTNLDPSITNTKYQKIGIYETFYDDAGVPFSRSKVPEDLSTIFDPTAKPEDCDSESEALKGLEEDIKWMKEAFNKPILEDKDLTGKQPDLDGLTVPF